MNTFPLLSIGGVLVITALGSMFSPSSSAAPAPLAPTTSAPAVDTPIGRLPFAGSVDLPNYAEEAETVVQVVNDSGFPRTVRIEWRDAGNGSAGVSGPYTLPTGTSVTFTTANPGEPHYPVQAQVGRDSTIDFCGSAVIFSDPGGYRGLCFQALRIAGTNAHADGTDETYIGQRVMRIKSNGLERQAGD